MSHLILHHYPQSPVAEKVRTVLGFKDLSWRSVEIPRLPPKPELMPLTGGYRRTPVLQIGADIYCDSQCIIRELQRRHPEPTLYPGRSGGMPWAVSRWTDGPLFKNVIAVVMGDDPDALPADFARDRGRLYFGPDYDLHALHASLPHLLAQLRGQLKWIDERLEGGRQFILGGEPGLPDALCYYLVWFVRGRYAKGPDLLSEFANLEAWEARVRAIGHGNPSELSASDALAIANAAAPDRSELIDPLDPQRLTAAMRVQVVPEGDSGDPPVIGRVLRATIDQIAILRTDPKVGDVAVHFPRVGYQVTIV